MQAEGVHINSKVIELMGEILQRTEGVPAKAGTRLQESPT